jgi:putative transcriptional regulator
VRLLQLIFQDETIVDQLRKFSEDKLMFDLNVDEKAQTIMGVHFDSYTTFRATLNAIASNMYEGFVPNIDDVKWAASGAPVPTPEQVLAEVRKENEEEKLAKQPRMG